ncbi:MAG TPA: hypothetical protein VH306_12100 [Gaiellaceae bacterium]|jgi:hypothetical protein
MLWALVFALPVFKMLLFGAFVLLLRRSGTDPGEEMPARLSARPDGGSSRPRTGRGPDRGGPGRRPVSPRVPARLR